MRPLLLLSLTACLSPGRDDTDVADADADTDADADADADSDTDADADTDTDADTDSDADADTDADADADADTDADADSDADTDVPVDTGVPACPADAHLGAQLGAALATADTCGQIDDHDQGCGGTASDDLAWTWVAPADGEYVFDTIGSSFDTALTIRHPCTDQEIACDDDSGGNLTSEITLVLDAGEAIAIVAEGYNNACGTVVLSIAEAPTTPGVNVPDPDPPIVPCSYAVPTGPFTPTIVPAASGYHGLAVNGDTLVGSDGNNLIEATSFTQGSLFVPNIGSLQQMEYLPNGDLVVVDGGSIVRIEPSGNQVPLASGINAYGLRIGPDGWVYTANQSVIHRIDPVNGGATVFLTAIPVPKVIDFTADGLNMYVGTNNSDGDVYRVELDPNGSPVLPPIHIGQTGGSWHDAINLDICNNVYVNEYWTSSLYIIEPGELPRLLIDFDTLGTPYDAYGHGMIWGSGVGDWGATDVYMPLPYAGNQVMEIPLGIPPR